MSLKVLSWNVEHADRLIDSNPSATLLDRRRRVRDTLERIGADVFCMIEGPKGEQAVTDFCAQVLDNKWVPVLLQEPGTPLGVRDVDYRTAGTQWIWFLVRPALAANCRLQAPAVWDALVEPSWPVYLWGQTKPTQHEHYRHPQVMVYELGNAQKIEFIGVHLKSKINQEKIERDAEGNLEGKYLAEALEARVKLASEARNVREYIGMKFLQLAAPGVVVMGDCNDGPGNDFFERNYLFFDLIGNVQGEVLVAERFLNHALFDCPDHLRWTAKYADELLKLSAGKNPLLLDHILMSQPLCRGQLPLVANAHAGLVEHEAYELANAGSNSKTRTSDHRPVSCRFVASV